MRPRLIYLWTILLVGCGDSPRDSLEPQQEDAAGAPADVRLALNWFPEAEHGGYYAAQVAEDYGAEGLNVEILSGGPGVSPVPRVAAGKVNFGVCNADDLLLARAQEAPVVALMAPIQNSPRCIMVHAGSGIESLMDLRDLTLAMNAGKAFAAYLRLHAPLDGVKIVPYPGTVAQFLLDQNYAQQAYAFSEPFVAKREGGDPRVLMLREIGFNPYTSVLITNERLLREKPEQVGAMVRASVRGWRAYLSAPGPADELIHRFNPRMSLEILCFGAEIIKELSLTESTTQQGVGHMSCDRWATLLGQLEELGLIEPGSVNVEEAFTSEFLASQEM